MKKKNKLLPLLLLLSILGGCGDDDDSTNVIVGDPDRDFQREEGPVSTDDPVRVNTVVNNTVVINNTNLEVADDELIFDCDVQEADPVVHQQFIYVAPNCSAIQNVDINDDDRIDRQEVETITGAPLTELEAQEGPDFNVSQRVPLSAFPTGIDRFIYVVYGGQGGGVNIPIICMPFQIQTVIQGNTSGNVTGGGNSGGASGGSTGGATGGTSGGTSGGTESGGTSGTTI